MPSKDALAREAVTLGKSLGVTVDTTGNHAELSGLVQALKAKAADAAAADAAAAEAAAAEAAAAITAAAEVAAAKATAAEAAAAKVAAAKVATPKAQPVAAGRYVVAKGRTLYGLRGQIKPGKPVRADDCPSVDLLTLLKKGVIVRG